MIPIPPGLAAFALKHRQVLIEIAAAVVALGLLTGGFFLYRAHLIHVGEERIKAKDAALVAAQKVHNIEVTRRAHELLQPSIDALKATLTAPPAADAPHLGCVRHNARGAGAVSQNAAAGSAPSQGSELSGAGSEDSQGGEFDPGPGIDSLLREADATVSTWRAYYYACRDTGICEAPDPH